MPWGVVYYRTADGRVPADEFLDRCPDKVEATILAVLEAVRRAPPPAFSGGGKWEAMHGTMGGYYEIRVTGPGRRQYRLFCRLENGTPGELVERGFAGPQIVVINGMDKPVGQLFSDADYRRHVRRLASDYLRTFPRRIALIVVWRWDGERRTADEVSLFPLVPWSHVRERVLPANHATMAGRLMVDYHDLGRLPKLSLYVAPAG